MSIETDIRFIAESIQWQNKLLLKLLSDDEPDNSSDKSEGRDDQSCNDDSAAD